MRVNIMSHSKLRCYSYAIFLLQPTIDKYPFFTTILFSTLKVKTTLIRFKEIVDRYDFSKEPITILLHITCLADELDKKLFICLQFEALDNDMYFQY